MHLPLRKAALLLLCLSPAILETSALAENLLYNSGFQLGTADYSCVRYMKIPGEARYTPPQAEPQGPVAGTNSLRFDNPQDDAINFCSHEFTVAPGTPYTFSVWLKSSRPGVPIKIDFHSVAQIDGKGDWDHHETTLHAGPDWKRYTLTMTAKAGHSYYFDEVVWGADASGATVWIGAPQVNAGAQALSYQPAADIECAFTASGNLVLDGQTPPDFALAAVNHSGQAATLECPIRVTDTLSEKVQNLPALHLDLAPGQTAQAELSLPLTLKGGFRVDGSWRIPQQQQQETDIPFPLYYAVAGINHAGAVDLDRDFTMGLDDNLGVVHAQYDNPRPIAFRGLGWGIEERFNFLQQEGIRLLRVGNTGNLLFAWSQIEPKEGEFDWALTDYLVNLAAKHQMQLMPNLGDTFFLYNNPGDAARQRFPAWLLAKSGPLELHETWLGGYTGVMPPLEDWSRFVGAVVAHYKGRISHYEILNEANLWFPPEDYARYLEAATKAAKEADPQCKIVGFCATGDLNGKMKDFIHKMGDLGAFQNADVLSFHPYDARNDDTPNRAADQIEDLRKLADAYKLGIPLWNTELYYLDKGDNDYTPIKADALIRRSLIDLGEGVSQSITLPSDYQLVNDLQPHWGFLLREVVHGPIPSAVYPATEMLTDLLGGGHPAGMVHWGENLLCYLYLDRSGQPVAACWARSEKDAAAVTLPADKEAVQAYDLFGNPLPAGAGALTLKLNRAPIYLTTKLPLPEFQKLLEAASVAPEYTCVATGARYAWNGDVPAVAVEVQNNSGQAQLPQIRLEHSPAGPARNTDPIPLPLGPNETKTVYLPIQAAPGTLPGGEAAISIGTGSTAASTTVLLRPGNSVALDHATTVDTPDRVVFGSDRWGGSGDSSFQFTVSGNAQKLTMQVEVRESGRSPRAPGSFPSDGDAVEFFLDPQPDRHLDGPDYLPDTVHAIVVSRSGNGLAPAFHLLTPGIPAPEWECRDVAGGYEVKLTLPWTALRLNGPSPIGFNLAVDRSDGTKRKCQIAWSGAGTSFKDRLDFGRLTIPSENTDSPHP